MVVALSPGYGVVAASALYSVVAVIAGHGIVTTRTVRGGIADEEVVTAQPGYRVVVNRTLVRIGAVGARKDIGKCHPTPQE
jgi:hypothetical protein